MLINISGSSGVGKTTIATILVLVLTNLDRSVLHLCGDDLHKWERTNENWKKNTHLNPKANNLILGKKQLLDLINGDPIIRDIYDHNSGKFINNIKIDPADVIINEGLHALYHRDICKLADLNVFIDTEEELTKEWKMSRDIESRGYTVEQVLSAIEMRELDEKKYIKSQIKNADAVVKFTKKKYGAVDLDYEIVNNKREGLLKKMKLFYDMHKNFLMTCRSLSFEYELIQGAGGNLSYKFDDKIVITSSGYSMSDISMLNGYSVCTLDGDIINNNQKRPSMEIQLHTKIEEPVVLHTHPIYLNTILCSKNSKEIISNILDKFDYISYISPGRELASVFSKSDGNKIVLLENHGLVCCGDSFTEVLDTSLKINKMCKEWLILNSKTFTTYSTAFKNVDSEYFIFPDAVALAEENKSINDYILHIQKEVELVPRYLNSEEVSRIKNMEAEKYRRNMI